MDEYIHWCGNCQIRIYVQRHYGKTMNWVDCPYVCEYKSAMKNSVSDPNFCPNCGARMAQKGEQA